MAYFKRAEFWHRTGVFKLDSQFPGVEVPGASAPRTTPAHGVAPHSGPSGVIRLATASPFFESSQLRRTRGVRLNRRGRAYHEEIRRILADLDAATRHHGDRRRFRGC